MPFLPELRRVVVGLKGDFKMEAEARLALAKQRYLRDNGLPCSTEVQIVGVHLRLGDYAHHLVCPIVYFFLKRNCIKIKLCSQKVLYDITYAPGEYFSAAMKYVRKTAGVKIKKSHFEICQFAVNCGGKAGPRVDDHPFC